MLSFWGGGEKKDEGENLETGGEEDEWVWDSEM
jgi:hypothetical protein